MKVVLEVIKQTERESGIVHRNELEKLKKYLKIHELSYI
jgi:hypothetical protein